MHTGASLASHHEKSRTVMSHVIEPDSTRPPPRHTDGHPAVVTGDSARQGPRGTRVLYVLFGGLALVVVIFGAIYAFVLHGAAG